MTTKNFLNLPAPAKLNLFLHVVGKRDDGYHLLESVFQLIDFCDYIDLEGTEDGQITRKGDIDWPEENDLCVKAAKLLQTLAPNMGVSIEVAKNIPTGSGLGGGSSDAATVLIGLNLMWKLGLSRHELMEIGSQLGADVPFFIFGQTAFAQGTGEILKAVDVPELYFKIIYPDVHLSTASVFHSRLLEKSSPMDEQDIGRLSEKLLNYVTAPFGKNDLQKAAEALSPQIQLASNKLQSLGIPRMTGSGSAVFVAASEEKDIQKHIDLPPNWSQWNAQGIKKHPLFEWIPA